MRIDWEKSCEHHWWSPVLYRSGEDHFLSGFDHHSVWEIALNFLLWMFLNRENVAILNSCFSIPLREPVSPSHSFLACSQRICFCQTMFFPWFVFSAYKCVAYCISFSRQGFSLSNEIRTFSNLHRYLIQKTKHWQLSMFTVHELIWTMQKGSKSSWDFIIF